MKRVSSLLSISTRAFTPQSHVSPIPHIDVVDVFRERMSIVHPFKPDTSCVRMHARFNYPTASYPRLLGFK
ncbi:MAG: hypothetical protein WCE81_03240 [Halobacteriota archaeon]